MLSLACSYTDSKTVYRITDVFREYYQTLYKHCISVISDQDMNKTFGNFNLVWNKIQVYTQTLFEKLNIKLSEQAQY